MRRSLVVFTPLLVAVLWLEPAHATNLTLTQGGLVSVELQFSDATFSNTLSIMTPNVAVVPNGSGCKLSPAGGMIGLQLLSEKVAQRGCRVQLDADAATPGVQPFAAGTVIEFRMCAQSDSDPACEDVWSSNPASNSDNFDHVRTTELNAAQFPGRAFQLAWEDISGGGDNDFNDLVAVVRVGGDADSDGLWDDWEMLGVDTNADGTVDLNLPGANTQRRNVYLEVDFMECATAGGDCATGDGHSHRPKAASVTALVNAFAAQPILNPDGSFGITLTVDVDDTLPHQNIMDMANGTDNGCFGNPGFDAVKANTAFFGTTNPRRFAYMYMIFGHRMAAVTNSGCGEIRGNDTLVTFGEWNAWCMGGGTNGVVDSPVTGDDILLDVGNGATVYAGPDNVCNTPVVAGTDDVAFRTVGTQPPADVDGDGLDDRSTGTIQQQATTMMHELGHNFSFRHGGNENENGKPNYFSVMNYLFGSRGIPGTDPDGAGPLTARIAFSNAVLNPLNENSLNEAAGIGGAAADRARYLCPNGSETTGAANGAIDWNCDGDTTDVGISANINGGGLTTLNGFNDLPNLVLAFQSTGDFNDGSHASADPVCVTAAQFKQSNQKPVAQMCSVPTVECQGSTTAVSVDGGCSFDPDGTNALTFAWTAPSCTVSTPNAPVAQATCALGNHQFTLTVTDPEAATSAPASGTVKVVDTTKPTLTVSTPVARSVCGDGPTKVNLPVPTRSDACSTTTLVGRVISRNNQTLAQPGTVNNANGEVTLRPGSYVVAWTATDTSGNAETLNQQVTVTASSTLAVCCPASGTQILGTDNADSIFRNTSLSSFKVDAKAAGDMVVMGSGNDCVLGQAGADNLSGTAGNDVFYGGADNDTITGCTAATGGTMVAYGNAGADSISAQHCSSSTQFGGAGGDSLTGSDGGNDVIAPGSGADNLSALGGNDTVVLYDDCEATSGKVLSGGPGTDTLITPLSVAQLQARGVTVQQFETVQIKTDQRHLADCFTP